MRSEKENRNGITTGCVGINGTFNTEDEAKLPLDKLIPRECNKQDVTCYGGRLAPFPKWGVRGFRDRQG